MVKEYSISIYCYNYEAVWVKKLYEEIYIDGDRVSENIKG